MEEHNCEEYRYTEVKFCAKPNSNKDTLDSIDYDNKVLISYCSLCGKQIRVIKMQ